MIKTYRLTRLYAGGWPAFCQFVSQHLGMLADFQEMHNARRTHEWQDCLRLAPHAHHADPSVAQETDA